MTMPNTSATIEQLRADFNGAVITPEDDGYEDARKVFAGDVDRRPAAIVHPANAAEVAAVVALVNGSGLRIAVRSGGHSRHGVADDAVVIDLKNMRELEIDVAGRTAWAQTGLTAGEYTNAVGEHGLATGFGDTGSVGIGGITLGGGIGFLSRLHGLTIDQLLAAEVVTADGSIHVVDEAHEPDLYWAIRGGGGNVGVVTRFKFRLHEMDLVVGGMLILPATPEVIAGTVAAAEAAPEELSVITSVMPAPPMPFVPAEHHGELVAMSLVCFAGSAADGEAAVAPLRALATPIVDMVRPTTYPELFGPDPEDYHPTVAMRTMMLDSLDADAAKTIADRLAASDATMRAVQIRVLGGAMARVPADATAYAHRESRIMVNVAAFYEGDDDRPVREAWVEELADQLRQEDAGMYVNFLNQEGDEPTRAAYPRETYERLAAIKTRFDPTNLFRHNHNIAPA